jgi:restriction system protein
MAGIVPTNVNAAFDMLMEEMTREVGVVKNAGHSAIDADDFDEATRLAARAKAMDEFRGKADALRAEWNAAAVVLPVKPLRVPAKGQQNPSGKRMAAGLLTPFEAYYNPILRSLVQVGGCARCSTILDMVEKSMKDELNEYDYMRRPKRPDSIQWNYRCQWARSNLMGQGYIKRDSPRGIWEISDAGREYLAKNGG